MQSRAGGRTGHADELSRVIHLEEEKYARENFFNCNPRVWLFIMCFLSFGSYYIYDTPAALQGTIKNVFRIDTTKYQLLYSLYYWPNVAVSVFGGYLLDRVFGIRIGTLIFSALVCLGQLVFALGGFFDSFIAMAAGRFIFGLGGENLLVAQSTYVVRWFKGRELNMVFGLLLSVSRIGSAVNMNINQRLYDNSFSSIADHRKRLGVVFFVGFLFCLFSLACAGMLGLCDWRAKKILKQREERTSEKISIKDLKDFPLRLWLLFIICLTYYVNVLPFIALATVFLMDKYTINSARADILNSLVYIISAVASPFIGLLVSKTGLNLMWLNLGTLLTVISHAMFAFLGQAIFIPYLAMVLMGVAYSIVVCTLWPVVAFVVPEHQLGTAYGIMQSIQNLGLAVVAIVAGVIVDRSGYLVLEVFFIANLCLALIAGILLYILDSRAGGQLNMTVCERARLEKETRAKSAAALEASQPRECGSMERAKGVAASPEASQLPHGPGGVKKRVKKRVKGAAAAPEPSQPRGPGGVTPARSS